MFWSSCLSWLQALWATWSGHDDKCHATQAEACQDPEAIVVDPAKGAISKSIRKGPHLQVPTAPVHAGGQGKSKPQFTATKTVIAMGRL